MCYNTRMGIGKRRDGSFYCICDYDECGNKVDLKAKDFYEASAEARKLGFRLAKNSEGRWVNFCTEFCKTCYFAPQITITLRKKTNTEQ